MACFHPLHAFQIGVNDSGKPKYQIEGGHVERIHPREGRRQVIDRWLTNYIEIPCGQCVGCRLDYSRQWATRCMLEAKQYEHNQYITLTYDEDHVTWKMGANRDTGEIEPVTTLIPDHLTKFMKDLRRYYKHHFNHDNIRFYACGEYGSQTHRAHYHLIIFNLPINDKVFLKYNKTGEKLYTSETIQKIWKKGLISVGDVTWNSAAYVARYVMKKIKGNDSARTYELLGIEPEFVRMSRKPGIAWQYFDENKDKIYECDEIIITNKDGLGEKVKPSKYYDRLYDIDNPEFMKALKERRKLEAEYAMAIQLGKTSLSKNEYLEMKEQAKLEKARKLLRTL